MSGFLKQAFGKPAIQLVLVIIVYTCLLVPTAGLYRVAWDEQTDMEIACSYIPERGGRLHGSLLDTRNTGLLMYSVAIVFALLRTRSLLTARLVSCLLGAFTIIGVYVFCKRKYDHRKALLACSILATSPYFLSFARVAFVEGDIFAACGLAWLLVCVSILQEKRTAGWAAVTALVLGLTLSAKLLAVAALPAVFILLVMHPENSMRPGRTYVSKRDTAFIGTVLFLQFAAIFTVWAVTYLSPTLKYQALWLKSAHYSFVFVLWVLVLIWITLHRDAGMRHLAPAFLVVASAKSRIKGDVYDYPYAIELLNMHFTRVFPVRRAFGIEVASVWRKNDSASP